MHAAVAFPARGSFPAARGSWSRIPATTMPTWQRVRTRLRASREIERNALHAIKEFPEIELISFAGLKLAGQQLQAAV